MLGFMHLIATNLTLWLSTLMREVSESLHTFEITHKLSSVATTTHYSDGQNSTAHYNESDGHYEATTPTGVDNSAMGNSTDQTSG